MTKYKEATIKLRIVIFITAYTALYEKSIIQLQRKT